MVRPVDDRSTDFQWGTFLFPGTTLSPGSAGNMWVVPAKAKNKDLAYEFIDITMSKKIQNLIGNTGGIPVAADPAAITDAKSKELIGQLRDPDRQAGRAWRSTRTGRHPATTTS